jgi:hypothetical protein
MIMARFRLLHAIAIAMALLLVSPQGHAACEELANQLGDKLGYSGEHNDYNFSDCKTWPGDPGKTLVAIARYREGSGEIKDGYLEYGDFDLDVLVLGTDSGAILGHVQQANSLSSDAIRLQGVVIDTAPYQLAPGARAFGVRSQNSKVGGSTASFEMLNLYVLDGAKLKSVLTALETASAYSEMFNCKGSYRVTGRTLAIGPRSSHGYADLVVTTEYVEYEGNGDCIEEDEVVSKTSRHILRFDGVRYPLPPALNLFGE